jgi:hypothetical protein
MIVVDRDMVREINLVDSRESSLLSEPLKKLSNTATKFGQKTTETVFFHHFRENSDMKEITTHSFLRPVRAQFS